MPDKTVTPADISEAIDMLWDMQRTLDHIGQTAGHIALATDGEINSQAEAISGTATIAVSFARQIQILLSGED